MIHEHFDLFLSNMFGFAVFFIGAGIVASLVHETGHIFMARHYGWHARLRVFPAWRSPEARILHGKGGLFVFFAVDMGDSLKTATDRQIRMTSIAGPAAEFGLVALAALVACWWHYSSFPLVASGSARNLLSIYGTTWFVMQGIVSPLVNLFPLRSALNDGQYFFRPAESRALLVSRTLQPQ
jgi:hypothetical protein